MENYIVETRNLKKYYQQGTNTVKALDGVDFRVKAEEFVAIIGKSGSGKSTLLHMIGGLDVPTSGSVIVGGKNLAGLTKEQLAIFRRRKIGFVFQSFNLLSKLTALENVELPLIYAGIGKKEREEKAKKVLKKVGLEDRMHHKPNELSGGQKQRVAIARALVNDPAIILADEPTGNLDSVSEREIMEIFTDFNKQGKTIIVVTHEPEVAKYMKRVLLFKDGRIIRDGEPE